MDAIRRLVLICALLVGSVSLTTRGEAEPCFKPLSNAMSRDPADFEDLAKTATVLKAPGVVEFLPLPSPGETTEVNIDFYYIKFTRPLSKTPEQLFLELRGHFKEFAEGATGYYGFGPYGDSALDRANNAALWSQDIPYGAFMSFKLDTPWPETGAGYVVDKAGDLQVTCATKTDFVFSTVRSDNGGPHPVSGNRGFGIKDNGDGTLTFYSKAMDRETDWIGNKIAKKLGKNVFCLGHGFWLVFYSAMSDYLARHGMNVTEGLWTKNHGPVPYPFGEQKATMECK